jgi:hypothetical protein
MTLLFDPVAFNSLKNRGSIAEDYSALCGRVSLAQKTGQGNFRLQPLFLQPCESFPGAE